MKTNGPQAAGPARAGVTSGPGKIRQAQAGGWRAARAHGWGIPGERGSGRCHPPGAIWATCCRTVLKS